MTQAPTAPVTIPAPDDQLLRVVTENGLDPAKAQALITTFAPYFAEAGELVRSAKGILVTDATQVSAMTAAREQRLLLKSLRTKAEKSRIALKADALATGKAIDGANRLLLGFIEPEEKRLQEQEEFAIRAEQARQTKLASERGYQIMEFGVDPKNYNLGTMPEAEWQSLLAGFKRAHEERAEQEQKAAEEREAAEEARRVEAERLRVENERLRAEAAERDRETAAERERLAAEGRAAEERFRKEQAERDADAKVAREAAERVAAEERRKREELERQQREREAEERRKTEEANREAARLAAAPDRDKLLALAEQLDYLQIPPMATEAASNFSRTVSEDLGRLASKVRSFAKSLGT